MRNTSISTLPTRSLALAGARKEIEFDQGWQRRFHGLKLLRKPLRRLVHGRPVYLAPLGPTESIPRAPSM
jgi:hypothetical protein